MAVDDGRRRGGQGESLFDVCFYSHYLYLINQGPSRRRLFVVVIRISFYRFQASLERTLLGSAKNLALFLSKVSPYLMCAFIPTIHILFIKVCQGEDRSLLSSESLL